MTKSQNKIIEELHRLIPDFDFYSQDGYEVKELKLDDNSDILWVTLTTGMIGDENTMAQVLCRKHRFFSVGKRGAITCYTYGSELYKQKCTLFSLMNRGYSH